MGWRGQAQASADSRLKALKPMIVELSGEAPGFTICALGLFQVRDAEPMDTKVPLLLALALPILVPQEAAATNVIRKPA